MSDKIINHKFNQDDLDTLTEHAITRYRNSVVGHGTLSGAIIQVSGDNPADYTRQVMALALDGFTMHDTLAPALGGAAGHYLGFFVKPDALQQEDLEELKVRVLADYNQHRRELFEAHKKQIVAESLAMAKRAEAKKAAEAEAKLLVKLEAQALEALGEFV